MANTAIYFIIAKKWNCTAKQHAKKEKKLKKDTLKLKEKYKKEKNQ